MLPMEACHTSRSPSQLDIAAIPTEQKQYKSTRKKVYCASARGAILLKPCSYCFRVLLLEATLPKQQWQCYRCTKPELLYRDITIVRTGSWRGGCGKWTVASTPQTQGMCVLNNYGHKVLPNLTLYKVWLPPHWIWLTNKLDMGVLWQGYSPSTKMFTHLGNCRIPFASSDIPLPYSVHF